MPKDHNTLNTAITQQNYIKSSYTLTLLPPSPAATT